MNIQNVRRERLAKLITEKYGTQARFVELTGANQGEVSALLKDKSFGERKARKIEADCGLPEYWLDGETAGVQGSTDPRIAHAIKVLEGMESYQLDMAIKIIDTLAGKSQGDA